VFDFILNSAEKAEKAETALVLEIYAYVIVE